MGYTHIFWDFDGTLCDTYPAMSRTFCLVMEQRGISLPQQEVSGLMQVSLQHAFDHYAAIYNIGTDVLDAFFDLRPSVEETHLSAFPHAKEMCAAVCERGGHNYLFTHRNHSAIDHLARFGMRDLFRGFVIKEDNFPRKPAPDGLLHLFRQFDINPADALMVGDRALDIESAVNAGAAGCFFSPEGKTCPSAKFNITSLDELAALL